MNWKKVGQVILWILFWYYLLPHYLLKKYVFKGKNGGVWSSILSVVIAFFFLFFAIGSQASDEDEADSHASPKVHYVVKKVGTTRLAEAKAKEKILNKEKSTKEAEYEKLEKELSRAQATKEEQEAEQKAQQKAAAAKEKKAQAAARRAAKEVQKQAEDSSTSDSQSETHHSNSHEGDLYTGESGKIIGNSRSHIYHVPGQAGYHMNSANAVYFDSEQDAINQGYRKAKR
ncbi:MAG: hypothetical protein K2O64_00940 [Lactobacillus sp.]|nr:hypothetical protein [Lactobacillus sp.]